MSMIHSGSFPGPLARALRDAGVDSRVYARVCCAAFLDVLKLGARAGRV